MTRAVHHQHSEHGQYIVEAGAADHALTISASGPDRGTALAAALTGVTAAILGHEPPSPVAAAVAVPLRADGPDFPSLVPALTASLFDSLEEDPALIGPIRIDGILRTDDGLTAWGYMLASSTPATKAARFTIGPIDVNDTEGDVTIRLQLAREPGAS
ncbi:MAG TPA: hypothetical protein VFL82_13240 [Thermomicrobiales bacterium]|nr:hypothetical protein [Thermomicrobiales bacterium]